MYPRNEWLHVHQDHLFVAVTLFYIVLLVCKDNVLSCEESRGNLLKLGGGMNGDQGGNDCLDCPLVNRASLIEAISACKPLIVIRHPNPLLAFHLASSEVNCKALAKPNCRH